MALTTGPLQGVWETSAAAPVVSISGGAARETPK
jgi:hypothetical protein